jgi:hypothetical protein
MTGHLTPQAQRPQSAGARVARLAPLTLVTVLAVAAAHELSIGRDEVAAADAAASRSDWAEAITHARAAAEAFVPGSPWPARGLRRLGAVGHDAEARGDDGTALLAYGAMRTAALSTRAPGSNSRYWRAAAEEALARVATARPGVVGPRISAESMLDAMHRNEAPAAWALAALGFAAVATLGGLARLASLGPDGRGGRTAQFAAAAGFATYTIVLLFS